MIKIEKRDVRWFLVRLGAIAAIIVLCYLIISAGMRMFNKSLGLDDSDQQTSRDDAQEELYSTPDSLYTAESRISLPDAEELPEGPEASWGATPCSIYVSVSSEPVIDSLPEAPEVVDKPMEAFFLVRRWAEESGLDQDELEKIYVFTKLDTIYVDLPRPMEWDALKQTLECRFICFTRLFPLVSGNLLSEYTEGISLRGIEGVFRR